MPHEPTVFVLAGNPAGRHGVIDRIKSLGLRAEVCRSPRDVLDASEAKSAGCVVLHLSGAGSDLDWLRQLGRFDKRLPVVVLAAEPSVETAVAAMKLGARDFLDDRCYQERLDEAIREAVQQEAAQRRQTGRAASICRRFARLDPGLREVLDLLLLGKSNRQIAEELKLSVRCIEVRRAKLMERVHARSLAELVRLAIFAEQGQSPSGPPDSADSPSSDDLDR